MSDNELIIERLTKMEATMESHVDNDNRLFDQLRSMHNEHFKEMKEMRIIHNENVQKEIKITEDLTRMFALLTQKLDTQEKYIKENKILCDSRHDYLNNQDEKLENNISKLNAKLNLKEIGFYAYVTLVAVGIVITLLKYVFKI